MNNNCLVAFVTAPGAVVNGEFVICVTVDYTFLVLAYLEQAFTPTKQKQY